MRIGIFSGYGMWGAMSADQPEKQHVGGGESTLIAVANRLSESHDVTVYANVAEEGIQRNTTWLDREKRQKDIETIPFDAFISFENFRVNAKKAHLRCFAMQCNHFPGISTCLDQWDRFVFVSHWHQWAVREWLREWSPYEPFLNAKGADFDPEKSTIIPNAIDETRYQRHVNKQPHRLHYSSSPDRGLVHLLRFFPRIREAVPDTELHVYYNLTPAFEGNKWGMNKNHEDLWKVYRGMVDPGTEGVFYHGPVDQLTLAKEQMKASLLVYPCDTNWPSEGFGISVGEAMAAGMAVLASDCDAIGEIWSSGALLLGMPIKDDDWVEASVQLLTDHKLLKEQQEKAKEHVKQYYWEKILPRWNALVGGVL